MADQDSLPCPGCHTLLPPEATGCQICMRPRTRQEIMRGYAKIRAEKERKRRRPFLILAAVLVLGGGGKLFLTYGGALKAAAASAGGAIVRWSDDMRNPSNYAMKQAPAEPPKAAAPAKPGDPVAPESAMRAQLFPDAAAPEAPAAAAPAKAPATAPKPLAAGEWRVTGTVLDLATLKPVPGAEISFERDGHEPRSATSGEDGAYEADLPKGEGWTVQMIASDHRRGQILDLDPSYRIRDADERRAVFANITDGDLIPAPVGWKRSRSKVVLDLFAVPHHWWAAPSQP